MLNHILKTKSNFNLNHNSKINNFNDFLVELNVFSKTYSGFNANYKSPPKEKRHWNNYMHAAFLSMLQEIIGYDLLNWSDYMNNIGSINTYLDLDSPNEGAVLEMFVMHSINNVFNFSKSGLKIEALMSNDSKNPSYLTNDSYSPNHLTSDDNARIIKNLQVVMKIRGIDEKRVWGDNDLIVCFESKKLNKQQFCVISCKTSLRERVYQSIFWATHSRLEGIGKHVFITLDKGSSGNSEIGSRIPNKNVKKSRDVLESTMDRVYVLRDSKQVNRSQVIKDFTFLERDLIQWSEDIAGL